VQAGRTKRQIELVRVIFDVVEVMAEPRLTDEVIDRPQSTGRIADQGLGRPRIEGEQSPFLIYGTEGQSPM
jgi:hypothetical protein